MRGRWWLGPLMVGVGVWCAAGQVTISALPDVYARIATPASFVWWIAAAVIAALVPVWRQRPLTATPALVATLPWWPVPLPAVALIWTGRLAWIPIAMACGAALFRSGVSSPTAVARPRRGAVRAGVLTFAMACTAAWCLSPRLPGGDEPHYLIITQSLLLDGDLRIQNNHDRRDYATYYAGSLAPDVIQRGRTGEVYSIHAPGTSVLVLPAFAMFGYRGAQAVIILLAAATGALIWVAAWLASGDERAAWFAWLCLAGSATFLIQSVTIFPDGPGAAVVAVAVVLLLGLSRSGERIPRVALVGASALLAGLPWLHTRFSVLAAGFGLLVVWQLVSDSARPSAARWKDVVTFLALPVVSAAGWFLFFQVIYGTPNPAAPYGKDPGTRLGYAPGGVVALLFDQQFGLLTYAPVLIAMLAAVSFSRVADERRPLWPTVAVVFAYFAAVCTYFMWWAGVPASPARFAAVALPAFAPPLAVAWARSSPAAKVLWKFLLAWSLSATVVLIGVSRGAVAWNIRGTRAEWLEWLGGVADLARGWPSFFWRLNPGVVSSEWPFAAHVAIVLAVSALTVGLLLFIVRRFAVSGDHLATVIAWGLMATTMGVVTSGWWFTGVSGLTPARSQMVVLGAMARHEPVIRIAPFSVSAVSEPSGTLRITADRMDPGEGSPVMWAPLEDVPAGEYDVFVTEARPRGGAVAFRVGRSTEPLFRVALDPLTEQKVRLSIPAHLSVLTIEPDQTLASVGRTLSIVPVSFRDDDGPPAVRTASIAGHRIFFRDDRVFLEDDGFWVRGGATARLSIVAPAGRPSMDLMLGSGGAPNAVTIDVDGVSRAVPLAAFESRVVSVPVRAGLLHLGITSPAGFRPSDAGASTDARYLGVRVAIRE